MKATLLLRKDHERVHELFEKFHKSNRPGPSSKRQIFEAIRQELLLHSNIENEVFYAALKDTSTRKETADLVDSLIEDHNRIDKLFEEVDSNGANNDHLLETKVARLSELVNAHVEREEEQLFSEARRVLSEQRLEELGLEMEQRRFMFTRAVA